MMFAGMGSVWGEDSLKVQVYRVSAGTLRDQRSLKPVQWSRYWCARTPSLHLQGLLLLARTCEWGWQKMRVSWEKNETMFWHLSYTFLLQVCVAQWRLPFLSGTQQAMPVRWCFQPPSSSFSSPSGSVEAAPCPCCPSWAFRKNGLISFSFVLYLSPILMPLFSFRVGVDTDQDTFVSSYKLKSKDPNSLVFFLATWFGLTKLKKTVNINKLLINVVLCRVQGVLKGHCGGTPNMRVPGPSGSGITLTTSILLTGNLNFMIPPSEMLHSLWTPEGALCTV